MRAIFTLLLAAFIFFIGHKMNVNRDQYWLPGTFFILSFIITIMSIVLAIIGL